MPSLTQILLIGWLLTALAGGGMWLWQKSTIADLKTELVVANGDRDKYKAADESKAKELVDVRQQLSESFDHLSQLFDESRVANARATELENKLRSKEYQETIARIQESGGIERLLKMERANYRCEQTHIGDVRGQCQNGIWVPEGSTLEAEKVKLGIPVLPNKPDDVPEVKAFVPGVTP